MVTITVMNTLINNVRLVMSVVDALLLSTEHVLESVEKERKKMVRKCMKQIANKKTEEKVMNFK